MLFNKILVIIVISATFCIYCQDSVVEIIKKTEGRTAHKASLVKFDMKSPDICIRTTTFKADIWRNSDYGPIMMYVGSDAVYEISVEEYKRIYEGSEKDKPK